MSGTTPGGAAPRPEWPLILQCAGEADLRVVRLQDEWEIDPELHARRYQPEDRLIDSAGVEYRLVFSGSPGQGRNSILPTGRRYSPSEVESLAGRHIAGMGAQPEWLAGHLLEIAESHRIRAIILYLHKLAAADIAEASEDEE
jgi:hypothetical protein